MTDQTNELPPPSPRLPANVTPPPPPPSGQVRRSDVGTFVFDGGAGSYFATGLLAFLVTVLSLGLAFPYALVLRQRWRCDHTFVEGRKLAFTGTGRGLFGNWIKWLLLIIVTLGIYGFWVTPRLTKWVVEHQAFATGTGHPSSTGSFTFNGGAGSYFGARLLGLLLTIVTLGLAFPFALVLVQRWRASHTFIEGRQLKFVGTGMGLFGNWIKWVLLTLLTLGIYSFWVVPRMTKWVVEHQQFEPRRLG